MKRESTYKPHALPSLAGELQPGEAWHALASEKLQESLSVLRATRLYGQLEQLEQQAALLPRLGPGHLVGRSRGGGGGWEGEQTRGVGWGGGAQHLPGSQSQG